MCASLFWPYLILVTAQRPLQAPDDAGFYANQAAQFAQFAPRKFARKGLTKCRDRHGQARPIICVPFLAVMSSLCVSISLFVSHSLFFLYRHRLWPVHKRADRLLGAHFGGPKKRFKNGQGSFPPFLGGILSCNLFTISWAGALLQKYGRNLATFKCSDSLGHLCRLHKGVNPTNEGGQK